MPWEERSLMDVRLRFVQDVHRPGWSVAEVCRRYQVSRKTGYKWLERYGKAGPAGLVDRSHRPYTCPHATPTVVVQQILALQRRYRWGARKVRWLLAKRVPLDLVPTVATVHRILERHGRTGRRRRAHRRFHAGRHVRSAQCDLDRGLQRAIPDRQWGVLLPAHGPGWRDALPARLPRLARADDRGKLARICVPVSALRPPRADPHR